MFGLRIRLTSDRLIRRLRWVMAGVIGLDTINTLLDSPAGYWQHPASGRELNRFIQLFVIQGWLPFLLWSLLYVAGILCRRVCPAAALRPGRAVRFSPLATISELQPGRGITGATARRSGFIYGIVLAVILVLCGVGGPESQAPAHHSHPKDGKGQPAFLATEHRRFLAT